MADSFGLKIGLEGEKEFKKALADINQSFKVLGSEMKLATSQFDKNDKSVEALAARNKVLRKEIDEQTTKIDTLRKALQNAATSFGENDRRTQNWQIQLNNAEAALNDMNRELDENEKAIKEGGKAAEESGSKFEGFGKVLKTVGVALGAVAVAAGAAAVKLGKEVIAAYADYEQLVGGVDTLFKDSSQEIQRYAANAYKTAGLSANEYMETVTGFSASLIQSLGGDTEKAAKYADMAITDMSDNANKMGTDMSSIQNAYQGFAKQNYTMLDNLKLGYGGTKQEMERLLADAEKISGVKYDISSYADVVEAIHVMQESMDIAGTTAKEAEATISGSMNALKSAVSNLIVGFGDANADMELLCGNMVDAFKTVVENITPVIENIIAALPTVLDALLTAVGELLPTLLESVTELFSQVLETLLSLLPQLIPAAVQALMTIVNTLIENLPLLIDAAVQLVTTLVTGIGDALPTLIPAAVQAIVTIVQGLVDSLPMILDAALQLITGLAQGLLDAIPVLIAALPEIVNGIICGGSSRFTGSQGSSVLKLFGLTAASTGINEKAAQTAGIAYDRVVLFPASHATYYPGAQSMAMKVLYEKESLRLLGAQIVSGEGVDKRIDVLATAIRAKMTALELTELDLSYAPPYSSAKDPVNMAGFMIEDLESGKVRQFHWNEVEDLPCNGSATLLDVRTEGEYRRGHLNGFRNIPLDDLREHLDELERDKPVYVNCQTGLRSYLACRLLTQYGFSCSHLSGGYSFYQVVTQEQQTARSAYPCGMEKL